MAACLCSSGMVFNAIERSTRKSQLALCMALSASRRRKAAKTIAERGRIIERGPDMVKRKSNRRWKVLSESVAGLWYTVILGAAGIACSCPYHGETGGLCKHVATVNAALGRLWDAARGPVRAGAEIGRLPEQCRRCRSRRFVRNGRRRNKRRAVRRHLCRSCGYSFSDTPGFLGRHMGPETVVRGRQGGDLRPLVRLSPEDPGRGGGEGTPEHNLPVGVQLLLPDGRVCQDAPSPGRIQVALRRDAL